MADDIVTRLRKTEINPCWGCVEWSCEMSCTCDCHHLDNMVDEAANEIERLRLALYICASDYMEDTLGITNKTDAVNKTIHECLEQATADLKDAFRE